MKFSSKGVRGCAPSLLLGSPNRPAMIAFPRLFLERNMQVPLRKSERASLHVIGKGCKSMCASPSAEVSPKSARAKVSHGRKARVCYVIGKGRKSAICGKAFSLPRTLCARKTPRASLASLSRLTKGESLLPIAQGYEVTHERARLWGLLWVRGGRKSLLNAWG